MILLMSCGKELCFLLVMKILMFFMIIFMVRIYVFFDIDE